VNAELPSVRAGVTVISVPPKGTVKLEGKLKRSGALNNLWSVEQLNEKFVLDFG